MTERLPPPAITARLIRVGFFHELRHALPGDPSLRDAVQPLAHADETRIVRYLREGKRFVAFDEVTRDLLDPHATPIGMSAVLTDGEYAWPSDLAHYVERYHVRVPDEFIAHMAENGWRVPAEISLRGLLLEAQ
jgi:hypothetical protein